MCCIEICLIVRLILCRSLNPNFYNFNQVWKIMGKKASFFFFFPFLILRPKQPRKATTFISSVSPAFSRPNENRKSSVDISIFSLCFSIFFIRKGPADLWKDASKYFMTRVYDMIFSHCENFKLVLNSFKFN